MSLTQFAMNATEMQVEELASLVKDNLTCKHLILSVEESLVEFLQSDTSSSGVLELEPMNSYNRLLLHRLADIFGFSHESVGEGEERHLILERCPETSIPSILVGDILWQYDEPDSPTTSHLLLKRTESPPVLRTKPPLLQHSLEEREAAYLAARERIFSRDLGEVNESVRQKPRSDPVVARRMIAHALGQRINPSSQGSPHEHCKASGGQTDELRVQGNVVDEADLTAESFQHRVSLSNGDMNSRGEVKNNHRNNSGPALTRSEKKTSQKQGDNNGRSGHGVDEEYIKREQVGAAKRMFANALGMRSGKNGSLSKCSEIKHDSTE
ncbi:protein encore isoform X1 [Pyrus x bretschneideri]|uniref:protein encore isoform X1 n=2 Tax=Pyrus x bretschneideri TaxID=225117 RepID=UPI00202E7F48|nr:protein encore isoform X1 [Pyrus x bretschneideri]